MSQLKPCSDCEKDFIQYTTIQKTCIPCAIEKAKTKKKAKKTKEARKQRREYNENDKGWQLKRAQEAFNGFIRERDSQSRGCISCGSTTGRWTAGHYKTDKSLRFNEDNCHGQCWFNCNSNKSGNIAEYRPRLVEKIGKARVEYLELYHPSPQWTLEQIIEIKLKYRRKLKGLQSG